MVKLRLDYFLMRVGLLGVNDVYSHISGGESFTVTNDADKVNSYQGDEHEYVVNSFAPRKNNGSQPVPDDFPVVVEWADGFLEISTAKWISWGHEQIESWYPDLEKLIEQQIEYDKAKLKEQFKNGPRCVVEGLEQPIEELMINAKGISASGVNDELLYQGPTTEFKINKKGNNMQIFTQEMKEAGKAAPIDSKVRIVNNSGLDLEYGEDILGLKVTVKSGPISIGEDNIIQVVEYDGIGYCFETGMIFPFKSQEEIEMEEAISEKLSYLSIHYFRVLPTVDKLSLIKLFRRMQLDGELAEIILPLEAK